MNAGMFHLNQNMYEILFLFDYAADDPTVCDVGFMGESDDLT